MSAGNGPNPAIGGITWQQISNQDAKLVAKEQLVLLVGSWLLGLLAVASVAVLVGGRMAEQTRRVGLLKAVGSTPGLVAGVLLAEFLAVALLAAAVGLVTGSLIAPLLTHVSLFAGMVAAPTLPSLTVPPDGAVGDECGDARPPAGMVVASSVAAFLGGGGRSRWPRLGRLCQSWAAHSMTSRRPGQPG
jgi:putative ABC transport system permease protein